MIRTRLIAFVVLLMFVGAAAAADSTDSQVNEWQRTMELLEAGDARAIDLMKQAFANEKDASIRTKIASILVTLRIDDDRYYEYLAERVHEVVDRDTPAPILLPASGQPMPEGFSDEFGRWCAARDVDPQQAAAQAIYEDPGHLVVLGLTGNPRAFDLLRKALKAKNPFVAIQAASGLAEIGDPRAIDPILEMARRIPDDSGMFTALALMQFDDPRATAEAKRLAPTDTLAALQGEVERGRLRRQEREALIEKLGLVTTP